MSLTVGSLFTGIGGFDLGLERAGMKIMWQSEIDKFACQVLKKHWVNVPNLGDITKIDWSKVEPVDVICGGYPCQPFSTAGKRKGKDDPRHLWRWFRDAISGIRPRYALLENVAGHLSMGGLEVIADLAEIGYDAQWRVVSAAGLGAPHRRNRLFIIAYPASKQSNGRQFAINKKEFKKERLQEQIRTVCADVSHTKSGVRGSEKSHDIFSGDWQTTEFRKSDCGIRSIGDWWQIEPSMGRVADGVSNRVDRLRGLGNAIVPQVSEYIGRLVVAHSQN